MVEEAQSEREAGSAFGLVRASLAGVRDQLILIRWVMAGSAAIAVAIFAYLFGVTTQTTVTMARIESRFDLVDEHFRGAAERSDEQFKMVNEQFKTVNQQFKAVNQRFEDLDQRLDDRFKAVNEQFKAVDDRFKAVDDRFKAVDQRFDTLQKTMDERFETMQRTMDQHFDTLQRTMDQRFDAVDKRLETLTTLITTLLPPKQKTEGFTLAPRLKNAL